MRGFALVPDQTVIGQPRDDLFGERGNLLDTEEAMTLDAVPPAVSALEALGKVLAARTVPR
jgi:hypothetical protein